MFLLLYKKVDIALDIFGSFENKSEMVPIQMSNYGMYVFSYALMGHEMFGKGPPP